MATYQRVNSFLTNLVYIVFCFLICLNTISTEENVKKVKEMDRHQAGDNVGQDTNAKRPESSPNLFTSPECRDDIARACSDNQKENFEVLECLTEKAYREPNSISDSCQHLMWNYRLNWTHDPLLHSHVDKVCGGEINKLCPSDAKRPDRKHIVTSCLIENAEALEASSGCKTLISKLLYVVFGDYKLMEEYFTKCKDDVVKLKCGRSGGVPKTVEDSIHGEENTIQCLESKENYPQLSPKCKSELLRVAELQSDDFHMDRPLYYACKKSRDVFCKDTVAGGGAIYNCLTQNMNDPKMPSKCKQLLLVRQQLINEDAHVDKALFKACEDDMIKYKCLSADNTEKPRRMDLLQCLDDVHKSGKPLTSECMVELGVERQELMQNPEIDNELYKTCKLELDYCMNKLAGNADGTKIMHCMLELAELTDKRKSSKMAMSAECRKRVQDILSEVDVADDYKMDRTLVSKCANDAEKLCSEHKNQDSQMLGCLMGHLDKEQLSPSCFKQLHVINYFMARNFRLDAELRQVCVDDAKKFCHVTDGFLHQNTEENRASESEHFVLPCLYRHRKELGKECGHSVRRLMHERANSIDMMPELEEPCMSDLSSLCNDQLGKGEELQCLEDKLEQLSPLCKDAIKEFVKDEIEDIKLDAPLMKACHKILITHCQEQLQAEERDNEEILDCLIDNKHSDAMTKKCWSQVNHIEILLLGDVELSREFTNACRDDIKKLCATKKTRHEAVVCLSEHVRDDYLGEKTQSVSKPCRKQLKADLLERTRDIDLDPELKKACLSDIAKFCPEDQDNPDSVGATLECLKLKEKLLSPTCRSVLISHEIADSVNGVIDVAILSTCKSMIELHCKQFRQQPEDLLSCLKQFRHQPNFDEKCGEMLEQEQIVENKDYRVNQDVLHQCRHDIKKYCSSIVDKAKTDDLMEGAVINCLKKHFTNGKDLSSKCEVVIQSIIEDAALDYREDPVLSSLCEADIKELCSEELQDPSGVAMLAGPLTAGGVEECLKRNFQKIKNPGCQKEVARLFIEGKADVHSDPHLYKACEAVIKKKCDDVPVGHGQVMICLLELLDDHKLRDKHCVDALTDRKTMWEYASRVEPLVANDMSDILGAVHDSPSRVYLYGCIITILGIILIFGVFCGRASKRVRTEFKNR